MEVKELRIGSKVGDKFDEGKIVFTVTSINQSRVTIINGRFEITRPVSNLLPISITEEWLLKFGFKRLFKESNLFIDIKYDLYLVIDNNEFLLCIRNEYMNNDKDISELSTKININYVHQLQNLYFALTGEELTPKS